MATAFQDDTEQSAVDKLSAGSIFTIWCRHLTSLVFPASSLAFIWTGPHPWYIAPLFIIPSVFFFLADMRPREELRQPADALPAWPFDLIVYTLAALQFVIVFSLAQMFASQSIFSLDMLMVIIVVGGSSGFSIITAHELIHRKPKWEQLLGRLLLASVLYEHFYTEHLRGHHVKVGTSDDPATAHFGETYGAFWRRTVPAQFKSAWRLEARRLGDADMSLFDTRMLRNRILHGIAVGWGFGIALGVAFGPAGFVAFVLQAFMAVRLLEAVNYFEHWGLARKKARVRPVDSWDTHSNFTYYGLVGLARHADHHAWPSRPYQQLRVWEEAPVLPAGYVGMIDMVMAHNDDFREQATLELERRSLGPFEETEDESERAALVATGLGERRDPKQGPVAELSALWQRLPERLRPLLFWGVLLTAITLGAQLEAPGDMALWSRFALNGWIFTVFAVVLVGRPKLLGLVKNEWASWVLAVAAFVLLGGLTDLFISST